ncbi:MAG: hypothetical protein ACRBK7_21455 [Acidimicrobiales bacterium]
MTNDNRLSRSTDQELDDSNEDLRQHFAEYSSGYRPNEARIAALLEVRQLQTTTAKSGAPRVSPRIAVGVAAMTMAAGGLAFALINKSWVDLKVETVDRVSVADPIGSNPDSEPESPRVGSESNDSESGLGTVATLDDATRDNKTVSTTRVGDTSLSAAVSTTGAASPSSSTAAPSTAGFGSPALSAAASTATRVGSPSSSAAAPSTRQEPSSTTQTRRSTTTRQAQSTRSTIGQASSTTVERSTTTRRPSTIKRPTTAAEAKISLSAEALPSSLYLSADGYIDWVVLGSRRDGKIISLDHRVPSIAVSTPGRSPQPVAAPMDILWTDGQSEEDRDINDYWWSVPATPTAFRFKNDGAEHPEHIKLYVGGTANVTVSVSVSGVGHAYLAVQPPGQLVSIYIADAAQGRRITIDVGAPTNSGTVAVGALSLS